MAIIVFMHQICRVQQLVNKAHLEPVLTLRYGSIGAKMERKREDHPFASLMVIRSMAALRTSMGSFILLPPSQLPMLFSCRQGSCRIMPPGSDPIPPSCNTAQYVSVLTDMHFSARPTQGVICIFRLRN